MQYMCAFYGFERSASAVNGRWVTARISKGLVFRKAKIPSSKFRLTGQFNRTLSNSGFFAPIDAGLTGQGKGQRLNLKAHCGDKSLQQRTNPSKIAGSTRKAVGSVAPKGIL